MRTLEGTTSIGSIKKERFRIDFSTLSIMLLTITLIGILSLSTKSFMQYNNLYSILFGVSIQFFAIIGFTLLMIMGELDMSVGAVYGLSGTLLGYLSMNGMSFGIALLFTLIICTAFGTFSGFVVTKFKVNSMMVTIGMLSLIKGINWLYIRELQGYTYPSVYRNLIKFKIADIHWTILFMILIVIVMEVLLKHSTIFKRMYFVGANEDTSKIYGIKSSKIKIVIFSVSSLTAALGGVLATSRIMHSDVTTGEGLEFLMITAAVLGGASLFGGKGSIMKSVLGLIFLAVTFNGMIIFKIDPYIQQVIVGLILIIAVYFDTRLNKK